MPCWISCRTDPPPDDHRHRRPYRPRQDCFGQSLDRRRRGPAEGREGARHHHRSRLCLFTRRRQQDARFRRRPRHERFVHTMLAGASGIDFALLVVAADDGIMPQTIEHLAIVDLLGIPRGLIALTKADIVSPERLADVTAQARQLATGDGVGTCGNSAGLGVDGSGYRYTLRMKTGGGCGRHLRPLQGGPFAAGRRSRVHAVGRRRRRHRHRSVRLGSCRRSRVDQPVGPVGAGPFACMSRTSPRIPAGRETVARSIWRARAFRRKPFTAAIW